MSNFSFSHSVFKRLVLQTRKNQGLFGKGLKLKEFADEDLKLDETGKNFAKSVKNAGGKEKLLVTSNSSFFHCVFKRLRLQTREKHGLTGKRLTHIIFIFQPSFNPFHVYFVKIYSFLYRHAKFWL